MLRGIAFTGLMGSGKSTAAKVLRDEFGFKIKPFAEPLKLQLYDMLESLRFDPERYAFDFKAIFNELNLNVSGFPLPPIGLISEDKEENDSVALEWINANKTWLRVALQKIGTDYYRERNPNYWVSLMLQSIHGQSKITVDDLRFENECEALQEAGFGIVYVVRPINDGSNIPITLHPSESELMEWAPRHADVIIDNSGDLIKFTNHIMYLAKDIWKLV